MNDPEMGRDPDRRHSSRDPDTNQPQPGSKSTRRSYRLAGSKLSTRVPYLPDDPLHIEAAYEAVETILSRHRSATGNGPLVAVTDETWPDQPIDARIASLAAGGLVALLLDPRSRAHSDLMAIARQQARTDEATWASLIANGPAAQVEARRRQAITPTRCSWTGCRKIVSLAHPITEEDLGRARCPEHIGKAAAA